MNYPVLDTEINSIFDLPNMTGTPERRLLMAIFERALLDYVGNDQKEYEEAKEWLFESLPNDLMTDFSFAWVCQQLDLDIIEIRKRIEQMPRRGTSRIAPWYITKGYQTKDSEQKKNRSAKPTKIINFSNRRKDFVVN